MGLAGAGTGVKPKDISGADWAAGVSTLANGFVGNEGALDSCGSCTIGVILKALRMLDSVGVVDIISLASESLRLNDSLTGLMFIG